MLPKWLTKYLPKHHEISNHKHLTWLGPALHKKELWHLNRRSVSCGVAAGLLSAFIPLPIQMISAAAFCVLLRGNILIAIALTWISNPLTFFPINYVIYKVGQFVTGDTAEFIVIEDFHSQGGDWATFLMQYIEWFKSLGKSILIGLPIVSLAAALIGYLLVNIFWKIITTIHPNIDKQNPKDTKK